MASKLLNVRLDEARIGKARRLRETGVSLSDLVREAIDARFEALNRPMTASDARAAIDRIIQQHPDPVDLPARLYDVHDRRASRAAVARRLARRTR